MTDTAAKQEPTTTAAPVAETAATPVVKAVPAPVVKAAPAVKAAPVAASAPSTPTTVPAVRRPVGRPAGSKSAPKAKAVPSPKRTATRRATTAAKELKMADTIKSATEKTQAYFAEAGERAKSAMAKGNKAFEDVNTFHKGNIEAIVESSKIAAKGFEKMGKDAAAYAKTSYEKANETLKAMAAVKSPTELFKLQSDFVRSSFDAFVAETSRSTEAALKLAGEVSQPISSRFALAMEKVKTAA